MQNKQRKNINKERTSSVKNITKAQDITHFNICDDKDIDILQNVS